MKMHLAYKKELGNVSLHEGAGRNLKIDQQAQYIKAQTEPETDTK